MICISYISQQCLYYKISFDIRTIDTPYLDGIRTHWGKVKSVNRPPLYLQATTAGSLIHLFLDDFLYSLSKNSSFVKKIIPFSSIGHVEEHKRKKFEATYIKLKLFYNFFIF